MNSANMSGTSSARCSPISHAAFRASTTGIRDQVRLGAICQRALVPTPPATIASFVGAALVSGIESWMSWPTARNAQVQMIDTSVVRVHQHGACIAGNREQHIERSRGGLTSKIHAAVDAPLLPGRRLAAAWLALFLC